MVGLLTVFETAIWILNFVTPTKHHNEPIRCSQLYHQWFWRWFQILNRWIKLVNEVKLKFLTCELIRSNYFSAEFDFGHFIVQAALRNEKRGWYKPYDMKHNLWFFSHFLWLPTSGWWQIPNSKLKKKCVYYVARSNRMCMAASNYMTWKKKLFRWFFKLKKIFFHVRISKNWEFQWVKKSCWDNRHLNG